MKCGSGIKDRDDKLRGMDRELEPMFHGEHAGIITSESRRKGGLTCQLWMS
jgi:hypothetical protein